MRRENEEKMQRKLYIKLGFHSSKKPSQYKFIQFFLQFESCIAMIRKIDVYKSFLYHAPPDVARLFPSPTPPLRFAFLTSRFHETPNNDLSLPLFHQGPY